MKLLFILLQPDPSRWGDPDELPINQHVGWLFIAALILGTYTIYKSYRSQKSVFNKLEK